MSYDIEKALNRRLSSTGIDEEEEENDVLKRVNERLKERGIKPNIDISEVRGLKRLAESEGIETEKYLGSKGEDPKEIFSGGLITDVFDVLNSLQYGVTGVLKGKSFSEGVKTRQSFSDKDALGEHGLPGTVAGIALDIAVDPLTYFGGFGIGKRVLSGLKASAPIAGSILKKIPAAEQAGNMLGRAFIYRFGQDDIYKKIAERSTRNIQTGMQNAMELVKPITKLNKQTQKRIADARKAGNLDKLPQELIDAAKPAFDELDRLGKEAVDAGLLSKEVYEKNVSKYLARLYRSKEAPEGVISKVVRDKKPIRMDLSRFKKRKDIPEDVREAMGEILEAGYPTAKGLLQLTKSVERAKFFNVVAKKWGKETLEGGLKELPDTKTLGALAGKYVPEPIYDDIQELVRVPTTAQRNLGKIVGVFKFGKVVMNLPTHIRNVMANFILNDFEGLSPARLDIYAKAAKELKTKGKFYQEAKKMGMGLDTFASNELKYLLDGPEAAGWIKKAGKKTANKLSEIYQNEEQFAKMAQFVFQRGKGLSPEDAMSIADKATFNYAQVTPFIRRMRESMFGYPFITFTYKATPQVARTMITKPGKISKIGKIKNAIENMSDLEELKEERKTEPHWVRDGFYVKLPMKDKHGRGAYFDLTYIMPFGDLISGQFLERGVKRETGLPEGPGEAVLNKLPFFQLVKNIGKNQDFFGNKIWLESDSVEKQTADLFQHITKTYAPAPIYEQMRGGYRKDYETGEYNKRPGTIERVLSQREEEIEGGGFQGRTLAQEMLRNVGLKVSLVDLNLQKKFNEREQRKALETILEENGLISKFERAYIPEDENL